MMINLDDGAAALDSFIRTHIGGLDIPSRIAALVKYAMGLGLEITEKTALGIGKRLAPEAVEGTRQAIQDALLHSRFEGRDVFDALGKTFFEERSIEAYVVDDTGFAKNGELSVGVKRQYSGTLGKVGNCQVAVSLHAVSEDATGVIGAQLYLPEDWAEDERRRKKARVPKEIAFQTKPEIALGLIRRSLDNGGPKRPVVVDAGYGDSRAFRDALEQLGLEYSAAVSSQTTVWLPEANPSVPKKDGPGRPTTRYVDENGSQPVWVAKLATDLLDNEAFEEVVWRAGYPELSGSFTAVRIRSAEGRTQGTPPSEPMWLLIERDEKQKTGFKYYFLNHKESTRLDELVQVTKQRWHVEYDYREMKQHLGLDSYEGRSWGGFHRHFAMVALMHAFVGLHREAFSPSRNTLAIPPKPNGEQRVGQRLGRDGPQPLVLSLAAATAQLAGLPESPTTVDH